MGGRIRTEQRGRVVVATLSNPPHALMTMDMMRELEGLVADCEADDGVGAVVLTGDHPDRFLAHFDVAEILEGARQSPAVPPAATRAGVAALGAMGSSRLVDRALEGTPVEGLRDVMAFQRTLLAMGRSNVVYIAAINGNALGGACELALACDFRFMAGGDHVIGQPEALLGFPPGGGGTQRLTRLLGEAAAMEIALGAEPLDPDDALDIGLITRVCSPETLVEDAVAYAAKLARRAPLANGGVKRAIRDGGSGSLAQGLRVEAGEFVAAARADESIRLMEAFVAQLEEAGELPTYDEEARQRLIDGTFVDLWPAQKD